MRAYRNLSLDLLEGFLEYDLSIVPKEKDKITDMLATSALVFKIPIFPRKIYEIEVNHRLIVLDNVKHWQGSDDDKQVERFLLMSDKFANKNIDKECCCDEDESADACSNHDPFQNHIVGRDIIKLKNNIVSKGFVSLEKLFDKNDVAKNPKITSSKEDVEDCNVGTKENLKIVNLSKTLSP
jgi:hypothetical protein